MCNDFFKCKLTVSKCPYVFLTCHNCGLINKTSFTASHNMSQNEKWLLNIQINSDAYGELLHLSKHHQSHSRAIHLPEFCVVTKLKSVLPFISSSSFLKKKKKGLCNESSLTLFEDPHGKNQVLGLKGCREENYS